MTKFNEKSKFLPYGWFITRILEDFNVNFEGFESFSMDGPRNKITIKNVDARMGVIYNAESKAYVYIGEDVENEGNQEVDGNEEVPFPQAQNVQGPSNQEIMDYMTQQFATLN